MQDNSQQNDASSSQWECAVCFEDLKIEQAVVTSCGRKSCLSEDDAVFFPFFFFSHSLSLKQKDLYCWPCLHQWMETFRDKTSPPVCPVCKNVLTHERIIPIFGRGTSQADDPRVARASIPSRPVPQREDAPPPPVRGMFQQPGLNFSFFGFGFPGMAFGGNFGNMGNFGPGPAGLPELTPEQRRQQQFLSQIMFFIGIAVLSAVFFA